MPASLPVDYREIRRIAITAIFSDDVLFERVVLKGGNALSLALQLSNRTSSISISRLKMTLKIWTTFAVVF